MSGCADKAGSPPSEFWEEDDAEYAQKRRFMKRNRGKKCKGGKRR